jgi:hypothetical protein
MGIIAGSRLRASGTLILDLFSNAAIALSLRKLRAAYTGSCVKVRRSSDDTELDIGFIDNELDILSLETFAGAGDAFVSILYDQSTEGNNAIQTTYNSQPKIVNSGSVILENGKPAIYFDGGKNLLVFNDVQAPTLFQDMSDAISLLIVEKPDVLGDRKYYWYNDITIIELRANSTSLGSGIPFSVGYSSSKFGFGVSDNYVSGSELRQKSLTDYTQRVSVSIVNGNDLDADLNTVNSINTTFYEATGDRSIGTANSTLSIGVRSTDGGQTNTSNYVGKLQEIILYKANQTSNKSGLENNINAYYSIY